MGQGNRDGIWRVIFVFLVLASEEIMGTAALEGDCTLHCGLEDGRVVCRATYEIEEDEFCGNGIESTTPEPVTSLEEIVFKGDCSMHCIRGEDDVVTCHTTYQLGNDGVCDIGATTGTISPAVTTGLPGNVTTRSPSSTTSTTTPATTSSVSPTPTGLQLETDIVTEMIDITEEPVSPVTTPGKSSESSSSAAPPTTLTPEVNGTESVTGLPGFTELHPPSPNSGEPHETFTNPTTELPLTTGAEWDTGRPDTTVGPTPTPTTTRESSGNQTAAPTEPPTVTVEETTTVTSSSTTPPITGTSSPPTEPPTTTPGPSTELPAIPRDCHDVYLSGSRCDGTYTIYPTGWYGAPFDVDCKMSHGGGWTVIQRREDGLEDFYRSWSEYKHGFGTPHREVWLGNERLHYLVNQSNYELRIDMMNREGHSYHMTYDRFHIGDEWRNYRLDLLGNFSGNTGYDYMDFHRGRVFTTYDYSHNHCPETFRGGWWYNACYDANLNGDYNSTTYTGVCLYDREATGTYQYRLLFTEMKVRPL